MVEGIKNNYEKAKVKLTQKEFECKKNESKNKKLMDLHKRLEQVSGKGRNTKYF